jgi:ABC-type Fe3+ transport system permease subunit
LDPLMAGEGEQAAIRLTGLRKSYGDVTALAGVDLTINTGEFFTMLGPSALLAFALSFDEVIVTTFTAGAQNTLPLWIFGAIRLGQQLPEVNVVVFAVLLLTVIPVTISGRLTGRAGIR